MVSRRRSSTVRGRAYFVLRSHADLPSTHETNNSTTPEDGKIDSTHTEDCWQVKKGGKKKRNILVAAHVATPVFLCCLFIIAPGAMGSPRQLHTCDGFHRTKSFFLTKFPKQHEIRNSFLDEPIHQQLYALAFLNIYTYGYYWPTVF